MNIEDSAKLIMADDVWSFWREISSLFLEDAVQYEDGIFIGQVIENKEMQTVLSGQELVYDNEIQKVRGMIKMGKMYSEIMRSMEKKGLDLLIKINPWKRK